jgi:hypothetical protein
MAIDLLNILSNKDNYNRYNKYISRHTIPKESWIIIQDLKEYYDLYPLLPDIDWEAFSEWFRIVKHPMFNTSKQEIYETIFKNLIDAGDIPDEDTLIKHYISMEYGSKIADISLKVAEGDTSADLNDINGMLSKYSEEVGTVDDTETYRVVGSVSELVTRMSTGKGLHWRLNALNKSCGPLRKGDFIIVGARFEVGKTSFVASEATYMAEQLEDGRPLLWLNNEQEGDAVFSRLVTSALDVSYVDLLTNPMKYTSEYEAKLGKDRLIIIDKADLSVADINLYLKTYNPSLIVIDQLWKVHGYEKDIGLGVQRLAALSRQAREWAKQYGPLFALHQADTAAEGQRWVEAYQLYESKTAMQGEADVILTIGKVHEPGYEQTRFINVPKNKLTTPGDPTLRHGKWEVTINTETGRFKD